MSSISPNDERYRFYRLYSIDLDTAQHSLRLVSEQSNAGVRVCLLRDIVVIYARPFSGNKGERGNTNQLSSRFVPRPLLPLHQKLLALRHELFAHTDHEAHNPRVVKWTMATGNVFPMSFRSFDFSQLERDLDSIKKLVSAVEARLNAEIAAIEGASIGDVE